jgi:Curli production assembly/transport component CsgG
VLKKTLIILTFCFLVLSSVNGYCETSFAIMPMEVKGDVKPEKVEEAMGSLYKVLITSGRYRIVDREHVKDLLNEQSFQMSGLTSKQETAKIGKLLNVDKLISINMYMKKQDQFALNLRVIDVASGEAEFYREIYRENYTLGDLGRFCAADIIGNYPLLGKIEAVLNDTIIVNIGENNGLKEGTRLFVARKEVLRSNTGEILFQEFKRIGTLEIIAVDSTRSKTKIKKIQKSGEIFMKGDIVSPEPIPKKDIYISKMPLLAGIEKGKVILDDDMQQNQYLSVKNGQGESYIDGRLQLNALQRKAGHAYCFYPRPYDQLENFIFEGDIEFLETKNKYNKADVVFRSNMEYGASQYAYSFFFNNDGGYEVDLFIDGRNNKIISIQSTPYLNRGAKKNRFRIVAYETKFDLYLNDNFVTGFEHEMLEKGTVGFMALYASHIAVSNVKIWEAIKKN